jgi:protein-S-isoprenylcysteine O-methyltransferase Ste14
MNQKVWIVLALEAVFFAGLLFGAAGTLRWPAAWAYLAIFFSAAVLITRTLARDDPALLQERMKPIIQKNQPLWDKIVISVIALLWVGWMPLMGLDAVRFGWSVVPIGIQVIGAAGLAVGMWICHRAFRANTFLAPVVKIQSERNQQVVSSGPYGIVRHPMYAGALILIPSTALLLGSWYGLAASSLLVCGLIVRTDLEDRELRHRLDGYEGYTQRVRYRLVPFVW